MNIRLSGVKNIRDFSEYGYKDHIRSAHLNELTEKDAKILVEKHDLKTVIDLRTTQEVAEKPDAAIPGVKNIHIPIFDEAIPGVSHESDTADVISKLPDMVEMYRIFATAPPHVARFKEVYDIIEDPAREGAVLWHCTEGKDRCGIVSAMFLLSHGVSRQEVMKDYLRTNRVNRSKAWRYYFLILLAKKDKELAGKVRDAFMARREYLEPVMDDISRIPGDPAAEK